MKNFSNPFKVTEKSEKEFCETGYLVCQHCGGTGVNPKYKKVNKLINAILDYCGNKYRARVKPKSVYPYCKYCLGLGKIDYIQHINKNFEAQLKSDKYLSRIDDSDIFLIYICNNETLYDDFKKIPVHYDFQNNRWAGYSGSYNVSEAKQDLINWIKRFKADGYFEGKYISPEYYFYKKCAFGKYWDLEMRHRGDICWVCHRHFTELKPFGGPGEPMVGDFRGVYILQIYRPFAPYDEEAEIALAEAEENFKINGFKTMEDYMISRYGKRQTEDYFDYVEASGIKEKSLECRECICLDSVEYHKKTIKSEATLSLD